MSGTFFHYLEGFLSFMSSPSLLHYIQLYLRKRIDKYVKVLNLAGPFRANKEIAGIMRTPQQFSDASMTSKNEAEERSPA
jgi:hypothetical protein